MKPTCYLSSTEGLSIQSSFSAKLEEKKYLEPGLNLGPTLCETQASERQALNTLAASPPVEVPTADSYLALLMVFFRFVLH